VKKFSDCVKIFFFEKTDKIPYSFSLLPAHFSCQNEYFIFFFAFWVYFTMEEAKSQNLQSLPLVSLPNQKKRKFRTISISKSVDLGNIYLESRESFKLRVDELKQSLSTAIQYDFKKGFVLDPFPNVVPQHSNATTHVLKLAQDNDWHASLKKELFAPQSHTTYGMTGVLGIPYDNIPQYYASLADDILHNLEFYLSDVHVADELLNVGFDLDVECCVQSSTPQSLIQKVILMIEKLNWCVGQFFPTGLIQAVVCFGLPYVKQRDPEGARNHIGVHIYYAHLRVDRERWYRLRNYVVKCLMRTFGERDSRKENEWDLVVDGHLPSSGLRVIFSRRNNPCPRLPKPKRRTIQDQDKTMKRCPVNTCLLCKGAAGVPGPSIYIPCYVIDREGVNQRLTTKIHQWHTLSRKDQKQFWISMVSRCTLRPYEEGKSSSEIELTNDYVIPSDMDYNDLFKLPPKTKGKKESKRNSSLQHLTPTSSSSAKKKSSTFKELPATSQIYPLINQYFLEGENIPKKFKGTKIVRIDINTQQTSLTLYSKTRYCLKANREHKCGYVYFTMTAYRNKKPVQLRQRCWCHKCKNYASAPCNVPDEFAMKILPQVFVEEKEPPRSQSIKPPKEESTSRSSRLHIAMTVPVSLRILPPPKEASLSFARLTEQPLTKTKKKIRQQVKVHLPHQGVKEMQDAFSLLHR
jgi:hypothetical protein